MLTVLRQKRFRVRWRHRWGKELPRETMWGAHQEPIAESLIYGSQILL
jgi:hypothetical protein